MLKLWISFWLFLILAILKHNFMDIISPLHSQIKAGPGPSSVLLHEDHRKSYPIIFFSMLGQERVSHWRLVASPHFFR